MLNFRSTLIGMAASAILVAVLGIARLFTIQPETTELTVREVDTAYVQPPPPPPFEETPPYTPPSPPALTEISSIPDPSRVPVPLARVPTNITAQVENFFTDTSPEPLPLNPPPLRPFSKPAIPKVQAAPTIKTHYKQNELDGTPRLIRHGSATFPYSLSKEGIRSGTVTFEVELSTTGSVTIRRVVSTTHADLVAPARKVAENARFTPPTRDGQAVKAIMNWPITIEK